MEKEKFIDDVVAQLKEFKKKGDFEKYYSWLDYYEEKYPEWYEKISKRLDETYEKEFGELADEMEEETEEIREEEIKDENRKDKKNFRNFSFEDIAYIFRNIKTPKLKTKTLFIPVAVAGLLFAVYLIAVFSPDYGPLIIARIGDNNVAEAYRAGATDWTARYLNSKNELTTVNMKISSFDYVLTAVQNNAEDSVEFEYLNNNKVIKTGDKYIWRTRGYTIVTSTSDSDFEVIKYYLGFYPAEDVQIEFCNINDDCNELYQCTNKVCGPVICATGQYASNHRCVYHACTDDSMCDDDAECINNVCVSLICEPDEYASNHACIKHQCISDSNCNENYFCEDNVCVTCFETERCDCRVYLSLGYECCYDDDCGSGLICRNYKCVECTAENGCECKLDSDCSPRCMAKVYSDYRCIDNICSDIRNERIVECCGDYDCSGDKTCNLDSHLCG
ncbi:MAG: dickkopf-related protein [Candidatus Nanoarchaeia archaeon]|nr:dickkopf-related protein [Candidatus Nanoarchaeia archaeon]